MIRNYFITAWRSVRRNKVYTFINVLGLSLGISACLIIYLITSFELSYDTFHPGNDRIYRVVSHLQFPEGGNVDVAGTVGPLATQARGEVGGLEAITGFDNYFAKVTIKSNGGKLKKFAAPKEGEQKSPVIIADPQYFSIFKYQWLQGNP